MTGPTGKHTIDRCGDDSEAWETRVKAHWNGFLSNNGVKVTKPVTIRFHFPAYRWINRIF